MNDLTRRKEATGVLETMTEIEEMVEMMYALPAIEEKSVVHEQWKNENLTTDKAIKYLESIIYEDFAPYTQKCLLKVIEAAQQTKSIERIVERLEREYDLADKDKEKALCSPLCHPSQFDFAKGYVMGMHNAIEIVKGGDNETC